MYYSTLWHILKDYTKWLVYIDKHINESLSIEDALTFKNNNKENYKEYEMPLFGHLYTFKFPFSEDTTDFQDITHELVVRVTDLANKGYLNDYTLGARQVLIRRYRVLENPNTWQRHLEKNDEDYTKVSSKYKGNDLAAILLAKEMMDWYFNPKPIRYSSDPELPPEEIPISRDYVFENPLYKEDPNTNHPKEILIKDNYTAGIREALFKPVMDMWNQDPRNINNQRTKLLQDWQIDAIKRRGKKTCLMLSRRSGKSLLMTYFLILELLAHNYKSALRSRTILFLTLKSEQFETIVNYAMTMVKWLWPLKDFFFYAKKESILYFRDPNTKEVFSQVKFLSAEGRMAGVGASADALYVDEAHLIKDHVISKLMPIVELEGATFYATSTLYEEHPENRFTRLCNTCEAESSMIWDIDTHILNNYERYVKGITIPNSKAGLRYSIDQVEVYTEEEKKEVKQQYQSNPDKYMRELYCRIPEIRRVINYAPHVVTATYRAADKTFNIYNPGTQENESVHAFRDSIVIAYDPAKSGDISALLTVGFSKARNKISIIKESALNKDDKSSYFPQAESIKAEIERAKNHSKNVFVVMDSTHDGVADVMVSQWVPLMKTYKWTGGDVVRKGHGPMEWNTPKHLMVTATQFMFDNWYVEIRENNMQLTKQLSNFVELRNEYTNKSKYQGDRDHDDFVSTLIMAMWTYYDGFGMRYGTEHIEWSKPVEDEDHINLFERSDTTKRETPEEVLYYSSPGYFY